MTNGNEHEIQVWGGFTYYYMRDQELQKITALPSFTYDFAFDALGRCVKRTVYGDSTYPIYYIYDGDKPILEYRSNGALARNLYGTGIDEIIQRYDPAVNGGQWFYFQQDHEGSVTHLTNWNNGSGQIIERYRYDAFGTPTLYTPNWTQRTASSYNNRFLFTGREYAGAWVYEYRARVYHAALGRFMSEDPKLFDPGDYNLFRYCQNDPIDFTDPMGTTDMRLDPWPTHAQQAEALDKLAATRELVGLSSTYIRAALSAQEGLTMAQMQQQKGADPKVSRETRLQGMEATNRSGREYLKTNTPYGVRVYELGGQIYYTKPVEGKPGMSGSFTEPYPSSPPGAHTTTFGHWHMPGSRSFSPLDNHLGNLRPVFKNFDPVRGLNHNNFYGPRQEYEMIFHGLTYHLDHYGDYVGVPHSF